MHPHKSAFRLPPSPLRPPPSAFTLVEMLVTVTIIGILTAVVFGALQMARESARESATKATIAKLHTIIMRRYESYMTRRVPIRIPPGTQPPDAARIRLDAIRDIMRMEMPERWPDISHEPAHFGWASGSPWGPEPALHLLYQAKYAPGGTVDPTSPNANYSSAKCLFLIVSMGNPEAMEQFNQSEIKVDTDEWSYFVDGWGAPIYFLRWAPGCSATLNGPTNPDGYSDIQSGDPTTDHDPFDTRNLESNAFHLIPLIFSFGRDRAAATAMGANTGNVNMGTNAYYGNPAADPPQPWTTMDPYDNQSIGAAVSSSAKGNITNHHIEMR